MTRPEIIAALRRLAEEFRALGLADYARGRAELHRTWADAASRVDALADDIEED